MKKKFDKYWGDSNLLISIATILDLKNTIKLIQFCFPLIHSELEATKYIAIIYEI